jgi:selenocysteine lyase/cysteine desulfurase
MLKVPASHEPRALIDSLRAAHLYADCRGTTLRLSPGIVTTQAAVDRLLCELERLLS